MEKGIAPRECEIELALSHLFRVHKLFFWKSPTRGFFSGKVGQDQSGRRVMVGNFRKDVSPYAKKGICDLIIVHRGKFYGVEVKTATGRQSEDQRQFEQDLIRAGGKYFLARSIEDGQAIVKEILKEG